MKQNKQKEDLFPGMKVIGITGGVGAGKSTVLAHISGNYDVSVIMADQVGAELMEPGKSVFFALTEAYGEEILTDEGTINKKKLAEIAFRDEESQKRINAIEHPLIRDEILKRIGESGKRAVFLEAALLKEGGLTTCCDEIWFVTARKSVRRKRLLLNRSYSRKKCRSIMKRQLGTKEFSAISDVIIRNDGNFEKTRKKIDKEMERLLDL